MNRVYAGAKKSCIKIVPTKHVPQPLINTTVLVRRLIKQQFNFILRHMLGVKTGDVFLCFATIVALFFIVFPSFFTSVVSFKAFYAEDKPILRGRNTQRGDYAKLY